MFSTRYVPHFPHPGPHHTERGTSARSPSKAASPIDDDDRDRVGISRRRPGSFGIVDPMNRGNDATEAFDLPAFSVGEGPTASRLQPITGTGSIDTD
jgi:hypothetical protein